MSLFVKICGISSVESAEAAVSAGADAIGFVLTTSPREVSVETARFVADWVRGEAKTVAVFRRPSNEDTVMALEEMEPDFVQADDGFLTAVPPARRLPVFREGGEIRDVDSMFLFEGPTSGAGQMVGIDAAKRAGEAGQMILAGGLTPSNVGRVTTEVRPFGVDVSSGVESRPGVKDVGLIREFVEAAKGVAK